MDLKIGFIGTGNMNGALIKGYAKACVKSGNEILAFNRTRTKVEKLSKEIDEMLQSITSDFKIRICDSMSQLVKESGIIVLGVEPQNYHQVMPEIAKDYNSSKLFISIAAGITIKYISDNLGVDAHIIRVMPNTPAMVGMGASAMCRNENVTEDEFNRAMGIFNSVGITGEVSEDMIHTVIGVSGSGPAYTYMYIDALAKVGVQNGMDYDMAKNFAAQTVMGAAKLVLAGNEEPSVLCDKVCSPGGTTIEAVNTLRLNGFEEKVIEGASAAINRSKEMTK